MSENSQSDNEQVSLEFVDGPLKGFIPLIVPQSVLPQTFEIPLTDTNRPYIGEGNVVGAASYVSQFQAQAWKLYFVELDQSPETITRLVEEANDQIVTMVMKQFYNNPDYSIYSRKPTGEHVQTPICVGDRKANVDEKMAKTMQLLWQLDFDTLGSCQSLSSGKNQGKAYISFPRFKQGLLFKEFLEASNIDFEFEEKKFTVKNQNDGEKVIPIANISFCPSNLAMIENGLEAIVNARPSPI